RCMAAETESVNVSDKITESVITAVFSKIINMEPGENGFIIADFFSQSQEMLENQIGGNLNIVYKPESHLIITDEVFKTIMQRSGRQRTEADRALLHNAGV